MIGPAPLSLRIALACFGRFRGRSPFEAMLAGRTRGGNRDDRPCLGLNGVVIRARLAEAGTEREDATADLYALATVIVTLVALALWVAYRGGFFRPR